MTAVRIKASVETKVRRTTTAPEIKAKCSVPARSHGNSYIFYEVANSYEFVRPHSYKFIRFFAKSYVFYEL